MGVDAADYDGSGRPSLLVTNYQNELPALYRNISDRNELLFKYSTSEAGPDSIGRAYVGFGTAIRRCGQRRLGGHRDRQRPRDPPPERYFGCPQRPVLLRNAGPAGAADRPGSRT